MRSAMTANKKIILVDADVVSHFISGGEADHIHEIFAGTPMFILDKVHRELQNWPIASAKEKVSDIISRGNIKLMNFPEENDEIRKEYFLIKKLQFKGDGESASLAVARFQKNILASSNLRDIKYYCELHKMDYLTTMDFLCAALKNNFFDLARCDQFINRVLAANGKLPVKKMRDHICREIDFFR